MSYKIAFYTYDEWAFGSIHKGLCKELYKRGIQADVINWSRSYTQEEFKYIDDTYDVFVTTPCNSPTNLHNYGVDWSKMILIAHGREDIQMGDEFDIPYHQLKSFAVITNNLVELARSYGIRGDIPVVQNGVSFDTFYREPSYSLETIGYASKFSRGNKYDGIDDWKRGGLVKVISKITSTPILQMDEMTHLAMPGYYGAVDCLMLASTINESCGLPLLESAAAGRVPISTLVGINLDMEEPTGYILPMDEEGYVNEGVKLISGLKNNPIVYRRKCLEAQEYAKEYYDWPKVIDKWIDLLV